MKKSVLLAALFSGVLLFSCNNKKSNSTSEIDITEPKPVTPGVVVPNSSAVSSTIKDSKGNEMILLFDNDKGTATVELNGETIYMTQDTTASGVRMHNDTYEYEEWQGNITLKKDGKIVFDNRKEVSNTITDKQGKKLNINFNNANNTAVINFDGKDISLKADTTASGLRFSNADYAYEEWKGHVVLKKNNKVVFDNQK